MSPPRLPSRGRLPALLIGAALAGAASLAACRDALLTQPATGRPLHPGGAAHSFSTDPDFGSLNSPNSGNYDGSISPWDGGAAPAPIGSFHFPTIIVVHTSGSVTQVPGALQGDNLVWGPGGTSDHQAAMGMLVSTATGSTVWFSDPSGVATVKLVGDASGLRSALNDPQPYGEPWWTCGRQFPDHSRPCWTFAGSAHLDFTRVPVALTLVKSTPDTVRDSTTVTFTAGREKDDVDGHLVDMSLLDWRWVRDPLVAPFNTLADSIAFAADTIVCTRYPLATCDHEMLRSGTMYAAAYVNGEQFEMKLRVVVKKKPTIRLDVSADSVVTGDTVFVTTTILDADRDSITSYAFAASGGPILASRTPTTPTMGGARLSRTPGARHALTTGGGVPECTTAVPAVKRCYIVPNGTGRLTVNAIADGTNLSADTLIRVTDVLIEIISAKGPNGVGSFLTEDLERRPNDPENRIILKARVTPIQLAPLVKWIVEDLPGDSVNTRPPTSPLTGDSTSFIVPTTNQDTTRWPHVHGASLPLVSKRLAYKVTAIVVVGSTTYTSKPDSVKQDERDVLRQEYIDWRKAGRLRMTRAVLSDTGDARRNSGDYTVWPSSPRLVDGMAALQSLALRAFGSELTVRGGFRNPVHHHLHGAGGSRPVPESPHLYGDATDFNILSPPTGSSVESYFMRIRDLAWNPSVNGCFEPKAKIIAGAGSLNHAHVDWRSDCTPEWRPRP